jgi:hypothetical protein
VLVGEGEAGDEGGAARGAARGGGVGGGGGGVKAGGEEEDGGAEGVVEGKNLCICGCARIVCGCVLGVRVRARTAAWLRGCVSKNHKSARIIHSFGHGQRRL